MPARCVAVCSPRDRVPTRRDAQTTRSDSVRTGRGRCRGLVWIAKRSGGGRPRLIDKAKDLAPLHSGRSLAPFRLSRPRAVAFRSLSAASWERDLWRWLLLARFFPWWCRSVFCTETQRSGLTSSAWFGLSAPRHRHFLPPLSCCACLSPLVAWLWSRIPRRQRNKAPVPPKLSISYRLSPAIRSLACKVFPLFSDLLFRILHRHSEPSCAQLALRRRKAGISRSFSLTKFRAERPYGSRPCGAAWCAYSEFGFAGRPFGVADHWEGRRTRWC